MSMKIEYGYWYCNNCKERLQPIDVTYSETCEKCGHPALWIEGKQDIYTQAEYDAAVNAAFVAGYRQCNDEAEYSEDADFTRQEALMLAEEYVKEIKNG